MLKSFKKGQLLSYAAVQLQGSSEADIRLKLKDPNMSDLVDAILNKFGSVDIFIRKLPSLTKNVEEEE